MSDYQLVKAMKKNIHAQRFALAVWTYWHMGDYANAYRCATIAQRINPDVDQRDPYRVIATHEALPTITAQPAAAPAQMSLF